MKKVLALLLALCMVCGLCACGSKDDKKPEESQPAVTQPTETESKEYVLLKTKADIKKDLQMTPENMDAWFESYTTTNAEEAKNAITWDQRKNAIEYKWTKENIPGGSLVNLSMFTSTVPESVIPYNPEKDLVYVDDYTAVIDAVGMHMTVPANLLLGKVPDSAARAYKVTQITITVTDRTEGNDKVYEKTLSGEYDLKRDTGILKFTAKTDDMGLGLLGSLGGLIGGEDSNLIMPALIYGSYMEKNFEDPIVKITCEITVDGELRTVYLGGVFTMAIDPNLNLSDAKVQEILASLSGNTSQSGGIGGGLLDWAELFGGLLGGSGGNGGN